MDLQIALRYSYANFLTKRRYDLLNEKFGSLEQALPHINQVVLQQLGCKTDTVQSVLLRFTEYKHDVYTERLRILGVTCITIEDALYPNILAQIPDPPVFLYVKGSVEALQQSMISIVGTRAMSSYGQRVTEHIVPPLVHSHMVTVSGLAFGVDAQVAKTTLQEKGITIAVLGCGLQYIVPGTHRHLAANIVSAGGAIVSEFPLDMPADTYTFPLRNRIIAGLSMGTLVVQAGSKSGAMITARLASEYSRDVFAVSSQIFDTDFSGNHQLIRENIASLVTSAADILATYNRVPPVDSPVFVPSNEQQRLVYTALTTMPQTLLDLQSKVSIPTSAILVQLTLLEIASAAKHIATGEWVRA